MRNLASPDSFVTRLRPSDIVGYESVDRIPLVLAGLLALLAVASATHALFMTIRRRRRDLAVFKTLGFTRGQVSASIAWQATTIGVLALLVGIPLGLIAGASGGRCSRTSSALSPSRCGRSPPSCWRCP